MADLFKVLLTDDIDMDHHAIGERLKLFKKKLRFETQKKEDTSTIISF